MATASSEARRRLERMLLMETPSESPSPACPPAEAELAAYACAGPPSDLELWPSYIDCARVACVMSAACARKCQWTALMERHAPWLLDASLKARGVYSWRRAFAARLLRWRLGRCLVEVTASETLEQQRDRLLAVADALPGVDSCYRHVVAGVLYLHGRRCSQMVGYKMAAGDRRWMQEAFVCYDSLGDRILGCVLEHRDTALMCQLLPLCEPGPPLSYVVAASVFHLLDTREVVRAVRSAGLRVCWHSALSNHRARERDRLADPAVPPLHASFYEMLLELDHTNASTYNHHDDVMSALDVLVEMHDDGRITRDALDGARDRIFARASMQGTYRSYRYLLDDSNRVMADRFAAAVVPFAMASAGRARGGGS